MLDARTIDALADALAERLSAEPSSLFPRDGLVRVDEVARHLTVTKSWVYDHQTELGACKLDGVLRFDAAAVRRWVRESKVAPDARVDELARRRRNGAGRRRGGAQPFELLALPDGAV